MDLLIQNENFRAVNNVLEYLVHYEMDHHSRCLVKTLPKIIELELPSLPNYLESRLQSTSQTTKIKRGQIRKTYPYGVVDSDIIFGEETKKKLF